MYTTRISTKGQIVIPQELRKELGWDAGTNLTIEIENGSVVLSEKNPFPRTDLHSGAGCAGYEGETLSDEEIDRRMTQAFEKEYGPPESQT